MPKFTEIDIRAGATSQSYERGAGYFHDGSVSGLARRGPMLTAAVEGSGHDDYRVGVTLTGDGAIEDATCTCPYDWGGYCKHIVAVLLAALHDESSVAVKPDLDTLLAGLSEKQLRRVVQALAAGRPELVADIEREVQWLTQEPVAATPVSPVAHSIAVDLVAIRREIRKDLRQIDAGGGRGGYYDSWDDEAGMVYPEEVLGPHQELAMRLLDAGDPATAASVITAMVEQWGEGIDDLDEWIFEANEDAFIEAAQGLSLLLAEALLSMDLTPDERKQWYASADAWEDSAIDLEILETALHHWWDYPPLAAAMQGKITEQGAWEGQPPYFAAELTLARMRILERQGRTQEYIHLAEAEGQTSLYVNMLARSGQVERAVADAQQNIQEPGEMLSLAQVLVVQGERAAALLVAEHGLSLKSHAGHRATELARWTAAQAQQAGDARLALRAAQAAFLSSFSLADYLIAENLAGIQWPVVKAELLAAMEQARPYGKIDIYLHEGMLVESMAAVDLSPYGVELNRVIEATRAEYPDWGIQHCKRQAESIMDAKKAKDYDRAVEWLRIARDIYRQHGRDAEWQAYLRSLLAIHERKYKLVPMLRAVMT